MPDLATEASARLLAKLKGTGKSETPKPVFRGGNLEAQTATDRELVLAGPAGTGKSLALLNRLHVNAETYPRSRQLILRKTRSSLTESALVTFEEKVVPPGHPALLGAAHTRIARGNRSAYTYPNGSTIVVGGMDEPTRLFSSEYDTIYWQEATEGRAEEWQSLLRALRNNRTPHRQLLGDCNPHAPTHWLRDRAKSGGLRMLETQHQDNPHLWDETRQQWTDAGREYVGTLQRLTGVLRDRLYLGLWVAAEGAIYTMFRRSGEGSNVIPRFTPPLNWRVILSIDFGYTHPLSAGVWVVDDDGRLYLENEIHMAGRTLDEHAPAIRSMLRGRSYDGVADSAQPESIERLRSLGIECAPAAKGPDSVAAGIRAVIARMAPAGDGKPRLFVMEDALVERDEARAIVHRPLCLLDELELYRWKHDASGQPKDEPAKEDDDACDQMRYAVMFVDSKGPDVFEEDAVVLGQSEMGAAPEMWESDYDE